LIFKLGLGSECNAAILSGGGPHVEGVVGTLVGITFHTVLSLKPYKVKVLLKYCMYYLTTQVPLTFKTGHGEFAMG